jgi:hypothetical protein
MMSEYKSLFYPYDIACILWIIVSQMSQYIHLYILLIIKLLLIPDYLQCNVFF